MNWKCMILCSLLCLPGFLPAGEKPVAAVEMLDIAAEQPSAGKYRISDSTSFTVSQTDSFWCINLYLKESDPEAENILEIFFAPTDKGYYQFYGSVRDKNIQFYPHGKFDKMTYPEPGNWNISYEKTKTGYTVRLLIPWMQFCYLLDQTEWKFNIVRQRGNQQEKWCGNLHKPEEWGKLVFSERTAELKKQMEEKIAAQFSDQVLLSSGIGIDESYNRRSWAEYMEKLAIPAARKNASFEKLQDLLLIRRFIAPVPNGKKYQLQEELTESDILYVTNLNNYRGKPDSEWKILLNGQEAAAGKIRELPLHVKVENAKKGDTVEVVSASGALEIFRHGVMPGRAYDIERPGATEAAPKRDCDGVISSGYQHRITGHLSGLLHAVVSGNAPRVFFVGDSITDGFRGSAWNKMAKYRPYNLGISGDWTQNVLWRLQNGPFEICKPELMVLMIGTNNQRYSIQEVADGIRAIVQYTQQASPDTKILILGIFPRGNHFPAGNRQEKINDILKTYADNDMVFYKDLSYIWIDENRRVRRDLLPDGLHPGAAGNELWADAMLPLLEQLLENKK